MWRGVVGDIGDDTVRGDKGGTLAAGGNEPGPDFEPAVAWERANGDGVYCRAW